MMKKIFFAGIFLLFVNTVYSQTEDPEFTAIEQRLDDCIDNALDNTAGTQCIYDAIKEYDRLLNFYYQAVKNLLSDEGKISLKNAQRKWLEMRDLEFEFIDQLYFVELGGTMYMPVANNLKKEFIKRRVIELKNYYHTLNGEEAH
jgi:uncharacterized protein YecT (DUF1311 family)